MIARNILRSSFTRNFNTARSTMPTSEFVIGTFRPDVAKQGVAHLRTDMPKIFDKVPGSLSNHVARVIKLNGKDISSEHKPILGLEWTDVSDFHKFYPASEGFQSFVGVFAPYAAAKAQPQLYEPVQGSNSFKEVLSKGGAQIFIAPNASSKKDEISGAWSKLLETLNKDNLVGQWSGWGIEAGEGTWAGMLGWKSVDGVDGSVVEEVQKLKAVVELDEYVVSLE